MNRIHVNTEQLRTMAGKLYEIENSLQGMEAAMDNLTSSSGAIWEGKAREEAEKDFKKVKEKSRILREQVKKRASSLEEVAASYEKTEGKSESMVQSLSVSHIFE